MKTHFPLPKIEEGSLSSLETFKKELYTHYSRIPSLRLAALYVLDNIDAVLNEFEPLEDTPENRNENKLRTEMRLEFKDAQFSIIIALMSALPETLASKVKEDDLYDRLVDVGNARGLFLLVFNKIGEKVKELISQAENGIKTASQSQDKSLTEYNRGILDLITYIRKLDPDVNIEKFKTYWFNGIHQSNEYLKETLSSQLDSLSLKDAMLKAEEIWLDQPKHRQLKEESINKYNQRFLKVIKKQKDADIDKFKSQWLEGMNETHTPLKDILSDKKYSKLSLKTAMLIAEKACEKTNKKLPDRNSIIDSERSDQSKPKSCFLCGEVGHLKNCCPKNKKNPDIEDQLFEELSLPKKNTK